MSKTLKQKLAEQILTSLKTLSVADREERLFLVVRHRTLYIVSVKYLLTADTFVLQLIPGTQAVPSIKSVTRRLNILEKQIALTPLLQKGS